MLETDTSHDSCRYRSGGIQSSEWKICSALGPFREIAPSLDEDVKWYRMHTKLPEDPSGDRTTAAIRLFDVGSSLRREGRYAEAAAALTDAIACWRTILQSSTLASVRRNLFASLHMLAIVRVEQGNLEVADTLIAEAVIGLSELHAATPVVDISRELGGALREHAMIMRGRGNCDISVELLNRAADQARAIYAVDSSASHLRELVRCLYELAVSLDCVSAVDKALLAFQESLVNARELLIVENTASAHHLLAKSLHGIGLAYQALGRYELAALAIEEALSHLEALFGAARSNENRKHLSTSLHALGRIRRLSGEADSSLPLLARAVAYFRETLQEEPGSLSVRRHLSLCLFDLGAAKTAVGSHVEAIPLLEESVALARSAYGETGLQADGGTLIRASILLGSAQGAIGDYDAAKRTAVDALARAREMQQADRSAGSTELVAASLRLLALVRKGQNDVSEAEALMAEANRLRVRSD